MKVVTTLAAAVAAPSEVARLSLATLKPDPGQPRRTFEGIEELAASLKAVGQLELIKVRPGEREGEFFIVYGERRYQAAKLAGLEALDWLVDRSGMSEAKRLEVQLVEKALRQDMKPVEQGMAFLRLMEMKGINGKQLAELLHISPATVSRSLALLKLPREIQERINAGEVSAEEAYQQASQKRPAEKPLTFRHKAKDVGLTLSLKPSLTLDKLCESLESVLKVAKKVLAAGQTVDQFGKALKKGGSQ